MECYAQFPMPILHLRVRSIVLLTLSPLALAGPFDLHVLAMPPAFNLSHDQAFNYRDWETDRKSTRLNSSHSAKSRMPSSA